MTKKLCVIGGGYWGKNHIKTLFELGNLGAIVESDEARLKDLLKMTGISLQLLQSLIIPSGKDC